MLPRTCSLFWPERILQVTTFPRANGMWTSWGVKDVARMSNECPKGLSAPDKMAPGPAAWFGHLPFELHAEVREQSATFGRFQGSLSLTWVIQWAAEGTGNPKLPVEWFEPPPFR